MDNKTLVAFRAINTFISALSQEYGSRYKYLAKYALLLSRTQISDEKHIMKNVDLFRSFVIKNREAVLARDETKLVQPELRYSDRIYVNFTNIFSFVQTPEAKSVIWEHLLTISALLDGTGNALELLRKGTAENKNDSSEDKSDSSSDFLSEIISKVGNSDVSNPAELLSNPKVLGDIMGSMQAGLSSGKLDLGKLIGSVQGMLANVASANPENKQMFDTIGNSISALTSGGESGVADTNSLLQMMTGMLGNMQFPNGSSSGGGPEQQPPQ